MYQYHYEWICIFSSRVNGFQEIASNQLHLIFLYTTSVARRMCKYGVSQEHLFLFTVKMPQNYFKIHII